MPPSFRPASPLRLVPALCLAALVAFGSTPSHAAVPVLPPALPNAGLLHPELLPSDLILPDAPAPTLVAAGAAPADVNETAGEAAPTPSSSSVQPVFAASAPRTSRERDLACQAGQLHGKPCRASWGPILWEFLESTAMEDGGNIALDTETRNDLLTRPFWSTYIKCVHQFRYQQWRDDDGFMVDYVGHGMQGAIVASSFEQHDPSGRGLVYVNNGNYWRSRLKAMAWVTVYEVQWKIGPASEASIGNSGLNTYFTPRVQGRSTNETGFQDFVDTPLVGLGWNVGEDAIDRFIMPRIWRHTHNKWALSAYSVITPCKAVANILRFKPLYYRDFDAPSLR